MRLCIALIQLWEHFSMYILCKIFPWKVWPNTVAPSCGPSQISDMKCVQERMYINMGLSVCFMANSKHQQHLSKHSGRTATTTKCTGNNTVWLRKSGLLFVIFVLVQENNTYLGSWKCVCMCMCVRACRALIRRWHQVEKYLLKTGKKRIVNGSAVGVADAGAGTLLYS